MDPQACQRLLLEHMIVIKWGGAARRDKWANYTEEELHWIDWLAQTSLPLHPVLGTGFIASQRQHKDKYKDKRANYNEEGLRWIDWITHSTDFIVFTSCAHTRAKHRLHCLSEKDKCTNKDENTNIDKIQRQTCSQKQICKPNWGGAPDVYKSPASVLDKMCVFSIAKFLIDYMSNNFIHQTMIYECSLVK